MLGYVLDALSQHFFNEFEMKDYTTSFGIPGYK